MKILEFSGIWFCESEPVAVFETDQGKQMYDSNGLAYLVEQQLKNHKTVDSLLNSAWQAVKQVNLARTHQ